MKPPPNELARKVLDAVLVRHPEWSAYATIQEGGDLELAVPAPATSRAGHLVISTSRGQDTWLRYSPPHMFYAVEDTSELLSVIEALLEDEAFFVVVTEDGSWVETTLIRPTDEVTIKPSQCAQVVSWSGDHDDSLGAVLGDGV